MAEATTGNVPAAVADPLVGSQTGAESSLSNWAGPYVTEMLGKGQALGNEAYNAYMGPLTAGSSDLQDQAFQGLGNLAGGFTEGMGTQGFAPQDFTGANVQQYMNPYLGGVQRGIESEGVMADRAQFDEERLFPYKQVQYMQSLLQDLPIESKSYSYAQPSALSETLSGAGGIKSIYDMLFGGK